MSNIYPGEIDTPILIARPKPVTDEQRALILKAEDVAEAVLYVASLPPRVSVPELVIKPTAQFPYSTTIGGDGLLQVITDAKGRHIELVDEVTGKLKPISAIQLSGDNAAGWIIFDPSPAALYLPGVYDYRGSDSTAPNVGFDVASPASGPADPSKLDLAGLFFVPPVVQGP